MEPYESHPDTCLSIEDHIRVNKKQFIVLYKFIDQLNLLKTKLKRKNFKQSIFTFALKIQIYFIKRLIQLILSKNSVSANVLRT